MAGSGIHGYSVRKTKEWGEFGGTTISYRDKTGGIRRTVPATHRFCVVSGVTSRKMGAFCCATGLVAQYRRFFVARLGVSAMILTAMPKKLTEECFAPLVDLIGNFARGARIRDIIAALDDPPPQRTLQDHLSRLVKQHRLTVTGKGIARRYHLAAPPKRAASLPQHEIDRQIDSIPLTPEAMAIREKVAAPLSRRKPVGYNRAFLDDYLPNETS